MKYVYILKSETCPKKKYAFSNEEKAVEFERFLKKGGGWRFALRRLV